ncbi:Ig-like domain repeat protein [Streptomyces sp. NBC_00459]|uniref:Ig-like domain repeat protein n=1 Tax=Streptomyces sp. NBC_00459 TaxID=2975749 RepID=UPI002E16ED0D
MHRRTLSTALAVALTFGSVALTTGVAGTAMADDQLNLGINSFGAIAVDGVHQRVFVSDPVSSRVVALDYRGNFVAEVSNLRGVKGLELSADSKTLYAAVPDAPSTTGDAIVAIDAATVTVSAQYPTGDVNPQSVAVAGGKLWFGYGTPGTGNIGSVDLTDPEHKVTLDADAAKPWSAAPLLDAAPGSGSLVAGLPGLAWSELGVYDVSSGTATATARKTVAGSELRDLSVTPDGGRVVVAAQDPYNHVTYKTSDLTSDGKYSNTAGSANAVAVAPDGTVAAGNDTYFGQGLNVYKPGRAASVRDYDLINGGSTGRLSTAGLGWAPDRSRLFAVTAADQDNSYDLRILNNPTKAVTSVSVTAPAKSDRTKKLTVKGKLTSKVAVPAGTKLTITRKDLDNPSGRKIGTATVAANGTFSFTNSPPAGGKVTYTLSYAGDADHLASSGSDTVDVSRAATTLRLSNNKKTYDYAKSVKFTAHLGKTYKNRKVEIWADPYGSDRPNKLVKAGTVNSNGDFSATYKLTRDTRLTARFTGDSRYAPKTVASTVYTKVKVSTSISRQYKNKNVYGQTYAYFHQATVPLFTTSMTAYPHRQQRLQIEYFYEGTWYDGGSQYFALDSAGISRVELGGTHDIGFRFRIRSSYIDGAQASGDNVNTTTHGAWKYFIFTS